MTPGALVDSLFLSRFQWCFEWRFYK